MTENTPATKRAMSEIEAAIYIKMSHSFLRQDRMNSFRHDRTPGPRFLRIGRYVRYLRDDLDAWLEARLIDREAE